MFLMLHISERSFRWLLALSTALAGAGALLLL